MLLWPIIEYASVNIWFFVNSIRPLPKLNDGNNKLNFSKVRYVKATEGFDSAKKLNKNTATQVAMPENKVKQNPIIYADPVSLKKRDIK